MEFGRVALIIKGSPQGLRKEKPRLHSLWRQSGEKATMHIGFLQVDYEQAKTRGSTPTILFGLGPG